MKQKKELAAHAMGKKHAAAARPTTQNKKKNAATEQPDIPLIDNAEWNRFIATIPAEEPVYLTVANYGYLDLLLNLYYTLQKVTTDKERSTFVVLTPDHKLKQALQSTWKCIRCFFIDYRPWCHGDETSSTAVQFKRDDWNAITRFKLLAIKVVLTSRRPVFYIDPDITMVQAPASHLKALRKDTLYIQQGTDYCTGVIFAHPQNELAHAIFEPSEWMTCGQDDETYVKIAVQRQLTRKQMHPGLVQTLNFDLFPNGLLWKDKYDAGQVAAAIQNKTCVLMHFNHIAGYENKIQRMKDVKAFYPIMRVADVPNKFKPALDKVCLEKQGTTYPPHHHGDHIEEACDHLVHKTLSERIISSPYTYLPIHWTAIAVSKDNQLMSELQAWCQQFFLTHKKEAFWTVVQHCKGLYGSCGVCIPNNVKLFMTSDPEGALNHVTATVAAPTAASAATALRRYRQARPKYKNTAKTSQVVSVPDASTQARAHAMMKCHKIQHPSQIKTQPSNKDKERVQKLKRSLATATMPTAKSQKRTNHDQNASVSVREQHILKRSKRLAIQHYSIREPLTTRKLPKLPEFTAESKWITIPLVSQDHRSDRVTIGRTKNILASFIGNIDIHPIRHRIQKAFMNVENAVVNSGAYRDENDAETFETLMQQSIFALCPRGFGTTSFRLTEAMEFGCIPVYISDRFSIPFAEKVSITDVCILVRPDEIEQLPRKLAKIPQTEIDRLRQNIKQLRTRYFTLQGCCNTILFDYIDGGQ